MTPLEKRAANHLYATMKAAPLKSHIEAQSEEEKNRRTVPLLYRSYFR